jgi:cytochrome c oxidase cbb3-type subunit 1
MTTVSSTADLPRPGAAEVDRSCRVPVLTLFAFASLWLCTGLLLNLLAAIKFHSPNFMVGAAWQTYGRIYPAGLTALFYGFALQAGLGVALWLVARLGRTTLRGPVAAVVATVLWNFAVFSGVLAILGGGSSGHELLEMPIAPAAMLFTAFVMLALCALATFQDRQPGDLFVSNWFLLTALFWFAWVYAAANLLLHVLPVRGVMQAVVEWWHLANFTGVVLSFLGLAAVFYFIPRLSGRPLHNQMLAAFVFWTVAIFAPWTGIAPGTPLPAWMPSVSSMFSALLIIPAVAVAVMVFRTAAGVPVGGDGGARKFFTFGAYAWTGWVLIGAVVAVREVSYLVNFTWLVRGQVLLFLYGFVIMVFLGAMAQVISAVLGGEGLCPRRLRLAFGCASAGALLGVLPLLAGGVLEGLAHAQPHSDFMTAAGKALMPLRVSTLGDLLMLVAAFSFALNFAMRLFATLRAAARPVWKQVTQEVAA